jgi:hypothetical protein
VEQPWLGETLRLSRGMQQQGVRENVTRTPGQDGFDARPQTPADEGPPGWRWARSELQHRLNGAVADDDDDGDDSSDGDGDDDTGVVACRDTELRNNPSPQLPPFCRDGHTE